MKLTAEQRQLLLRRFAVLATAKTACSLEEATSQIRSLELQSDGFLEFPSAAFDLTHEIEMGRCPLLNLEPSKAKETAIAALDRYDAGGTGLGSPNNVRRIFTDTHGTRQRTLDLLVAGTEYLVRLGLLTEVNAGFVSDRKMVAAFVGLDKPEIFWRLPPERRTMSGPKIIETQGGRQDPNLIVDDQGLPLLRVAMDKSSDEGWNYHYSTGSIPMIGREEEMERLVEFLTWEPAFAWMAIEGHGGEGKSRLAWELCLHAKEKLKWETVGFLESDFAPDAQHDIQKWVETWRSWKPNGHVLVVVDYVFRQNLAFWGALSLMLAKRTDWREHDRVRFLFLERQSEGEMWKPFWPDSQKDKDRLSAHGDDIMRLGPLDDADVWRLMVEQYWLEDKREPDDAIRKACFRSDESEHDSRIAAEWLPSTSMETAVENLKQSDGGRCRALFARFAGTKLAHDSSIEPWTLDNLLRKPLVRLVGGEWSSGAPGIKIDHPHLNLLFLATLIGGVDSDSLESVRAALPERFRKWLPDPEPDPGALSRNLAQLKRLSGFCGKLGNPWKLGSLQPDPFGEAFAMQWLQGDPLLEEVAGDDACIGKYQEAAIAILHAAFATHQEDVLEFLRRAIVDFPNPVGRWKAFQDLPVEELDLSYSQIVSLAPLALFRRVRRLSLAFCRSADDAGLESLSKMARLTRLALSGCSGVDAAGIESLSKMAGLTSLDLTGCDGLDATCLEALSKMASLRSLDLAGWHDMNAAALEALSKMTGLRSLVLRDCWALNAACLEALSNMVGLRSLDLRLCPVNGLRVFAG